MRIIPVYIGHKLTDAPPGFVKRMESLFATVFSDLLQCRRIPFLGLDWTDPAKVYESDIVNGVGQASVAVLVLDEPSEDVIEEMCAALYKYGIPIVLLHQGHRNISGLIRGTVATYQDRFLFETYQTPGDVIAVIQKAIQIFKLDTLHPVTFPCLESLKPNPAFQHPAFLPEGSASEGASDIKRRHEQIRSER